MITLIDSTQEGSTIELGNKQIEPEVSTTQQEPDIENSNVVEGDVVTKHDPVDPEVTKEGDNKGEPTDVTNNGGVSEVNELGSDLEFNGRSYEITIDKDLMEECKEKGIDANSVANELYAKGGDGKLSDETYDKLVSAFGKFSTDSFLRSTLKENNISMEKQDSAGLEVTKADEEAYSNALSVVGGEESYAKLEEFALDTLTDSELDGYNQAMESGSSFLQENVLKALMGRMGDKQGNGRPSLVSGGGSPTHVDTSAISREEYINGITKATKEFRGDKIGYSKAMALLDARRAKSL